MGVQRHRCHLLVVDDDPTTLQLVRSTVGEEFEVRVAESVEEAMSILSDRPADIVLSDQHMPGGSGVDLLGWCRQHWPDSVRMLMTAAARLEDLIDAVNCGQIRRFLLKPWQPDHLREILREESRQFLLERSHEALLDQYRRLNLSLEQRVQDRTRELESAYRQLQQRNLILQRMALTDPLTGLPNRRGMDRLVTHELMRRARSPYPLALAMIDVDHFKDVNTRYLLSGGDHVLSWIARLFADTIRTVDTIGRVGGEEFMLVAPETDMGGATTLAERVRRTVEGASTFFNNQEIRITVSVGLIAIPVTSSPAYEEIRRAADAALSDAKMAGRNRCVVRELAEDAAGRMCVRDLSVDGDVGLV